MRFAALVALVAPAALAHAQPLLAVPIDAEFSISRFVQLSPDQAPSVRSRGGAGGGSSTSGGGASAASFGEEFPFNLDTNLRENVINADVEVIAGDAPVGMISATSTAFRQTWFRTSETIRWRISGVAGAELSSLEGDWGSALIEVVLRKGVSEFVLARVEANEGEVVLDNGGLLDHDGPFGNEDYFFFVRASAHVNTEAAIGQHARAWADVSLELLPLGCSFADIAMPLGQLDINDVIAFLAAWAAQDEDADLAAPLGVFNISDVQAFLTMFGEGCP